MYVTAWNREKFTKASMCLYGTSVWRTDRQTKLR